MQAAWHRCLTGVLAATHDLGETCKGATSTFWLLKALAQLLDLCIHHADKAHVVKAQHALLPGEAILRCAPTAGFSTWHIYATWVYVTGLMHCRQLCMRLQ